MKHVQNPKEMFEKVFSEENVYTIQKKFRISRIFEGENELMECLAKKKRANNKAN